MARQFNVTGNNIQLASAVASGTLAIFVEFRIPNPFDALAHCLFGIYQATTIDGYRIDVLANRTVAGIARASGTPNQAVAANAVADVGWHCVLAQFQSTTSRTVRHDFGPIASNTTSTIPGVLTKSVIGARDAGGVISNELGHEVARVAVWNVADITNEEYCAMLGGVPFSEIRPSNTALCADIDLTGDVFDYFNRPWVITGTSVVDHPPPVKPWWIERLFAPTAAAAFAARKSVMINQAVNRASTY